MSTPRVTVESSRNDVSLGEGVVFFAIYCAVAFYITVAVRMFFVPTPAPGAFTRSYLLFTLAITALSASSMALVWRDRRAQLIGFTMGFLVLCAVTQGLLSQYF